MNQQLRAVAWLGALLALLAACSPPAATAPTAAPTQPPAAKAAAGGAPTGEQALADAQARYYEAAKREGKLVLYGSGTPEQFDPIKAAFERRFPGIEVQGVDQRGPVTREKIFTEQASRSYVADIAISGFTAQMELLDAGYVEPSQSPQIPHMIPEFVAPGGNFNPRTATLRGFAVNTNLVPPDQEPKTWMDVLDPKWRGKLAIEDPRGQGPGLIVLAGVEQVYGTDWSTRLKQQEPHFANQAGPLWAGLARGEFAIFLSAGDSDAVIQRKGGAPIKFIKPQDGVGLAYTSMSNIKNQPHPNAARLFIEWSLSEEGQTALADQGYVPVRKGIKAKEPEASADGVKFLPEGTTAEADAKLGTLTERTRRWDALFFSAQ